VPAFRPSSPRACARASTYRCDVSINYNYRTLRVMVIDAADTVTQHLENHGKQFANARTSTSARLRVKHGTLYRMHLSSEDLINGVSFPLVRRSHLQHGRCSCNVSQLACARSQHLCQRHAQYKSQRTLGFLCSAQRLMSGTSRRSGLSSHTTTCRKLSRYKTGIRSV